MPETKHFYFPVTKFLRGQLREIDSLRIAPLRILKFKGETDSTWISLDDVRKRASPFLTPEIDSANLLRLFNETTFMDQTLNTLTLTYSKSSNASDTFRLRNWDVYIDPVKHIIQKVYIVKMENINGEQQTQELTWKTGYWYKILTFPSDTGHVQDIKEEIVIWNFNH